MKENILSLILIDVMAVKFTASKDGMLNFTYSPTIPGWSVIMPKLRVTAEEEQLTSNAAAEKQLFTDK